MHAVLDGHERDLITHVAQSAAFGYGSVRIENFERIGQCHEKALAPVRTQITVPLAPAEAFVLFTDGIDRWWLRSHHIGAAPLRTAVLEPRSGGRWYEVGEDGSEQSWGRVLAWEAPDRVVLAWQLNAEWTYDPDFETTVEVRFTPDGDHTIVDFEHRDLERFGEKAEAVRGDYETGMDGGWRSLLDAYQKAAEAA